MCGLGQVVGHSAADSICIEEMMVHLSPCETIRYETRLSLLCLHCRSVPNTSLC